MKKVIVLMAITLLVFGMVGSASALYIDFTDSVWAGADGESTYTVTYDGLEVTLTGTGTSIFGTSSRDLTYQDDGIGLDSILGQDDEVDSFETLQVSFNPDAIVNGIYLYDVDSDETALYQLEGSIWVSASGSSGADDLFEIVTNSDDLISWVRISAASGGGFFSHWSDNVALAGLDVSVAPVPEPATMLLLGTGLVGLAATSRKKIFKKK